MTAVVVFPGSALDAPDVRRAVETVNRRFGAVCVVFAAPDNQRGAIAESLGQAIPVLRWPLETDLDVLVFVDGYERDNLLEDWRANAKDGPARRIYNLHQGTRLRLVEPETYDATEYPLFDVHVFNRLSRRKNGYFYTPWGPGLSDVELGAVNEFGFRVPLTYAELTKRDPHHKLLVVVGGSSAFSYFCFDDETFSARLETDLNDAAAQAGKNLRFTVLNFGMHDNVVMQEMANYTTFIAPLRPDMVIAHDGHNDIYYGLQTDPYLLTRFGVIYQHLHEDWAKLVQGTEKIPTAKLCSVTIGRQEINLPDNVIDVYLTRKRQFMAMVGAQGGHFLWGLQPLHPSKGRLSAREIMKNRANGYTDDSAGHKKWKRCLYHAYDMLSARLDKEPGIDLVNFHTQFHGYGEQDELFWDYCHLSPDGDKAVARAYAERIAPIFGFSFENSDRSGD